LREQFKSSHEGRISEYLTEKNYLVHCQEFSREKISLVSSAGTGNGNTEQEHFGALEGKPCLRSCRLRGGSAAWVSCDRTALGTSTVSVASAHEELARRLHYQ